METLNKLQVIDGESLLDMELTVPKFCVRGLLPQGLSILGGAPKIGKSWLVMHLCLCVANGEPIWNLDTAKGTTLYLCLEDPLYRIRQRLESITDDASPELYFANAAGTLADDLVQQITDFIHEHPQTNLIVIDTFQMVRATHNEPSYGGDYQELQKLKQLADAQMLSILLVHHLRKQSDRDPVNKLSGTTGISGAVDAIFVLDKDERKQNTAKLICTGRDIEYRELELCFNKDTTIWELISDSLETPEKLLPSEMIAFIEFMKLTHSFHGISTELADQFNSYTKLDISAVGLKKMMRKFREQLKEQGVTFRDHRSNGQRLVKVMFEPPLDEATEVTEVTVESVS